MQYYSTNNPDNKTTFTEAILTGLAEDGGLFLPESIPSIDVANIPKDISFPDLAFLIARNFIDVAEIPDADLKKFIDDAYDFPIPIEKVTEQISVLELFHGPTAAFKDFAARFMARVVAYLLGQKSQPKNILVATSGDTGGAIGSGFLGQPGVNVFILYPSGGVSPLQEKQLTTMGGNIKAIEVDGNFDDCQRLVKEAFGNPKMLEKFQLMSANSINIGRIIPQCFYYAWVSLQRPGAVFSIPSGNLGNSTGAIFAHKMGFPIQHIIVAHNQNHPFVEYVNTGQFVPTPSVATLSNAMDIGHPNNFYRICKIFDTQEDLQKLVTAYWFDDAQTADAIKSVWETDNYLMCPHTAVGYLGAQKFVNENNSDEKIIVAGTAHPAKFIESVQEITGTEVVIPEHLKPALAKEKNAINMTPDLTSLNAILDREI